MNKYAIVIFVLLVIGLLAFNYYTNSTAPTTYWKDTQIACLPNGHENLSMHIHPELFVYVNEEPEVVPSGIGLAPSCMSEVHTHDASGKIHAESVVERTFALGDFYDVWGQTLERDGFTVTVSVDGEVVSDPLAVTLADHQRIEVRYTSAE